MAAAEDRTAVAGPLAWGGGAAQAMYRAAQAVTQPGGPELLAGLVRELAEILQVASVFVAVFADESQRELRTLAVWLDGRLLRNFDYPLEGSPCAQVVGRAFRHVAQGVAAEFRPNTIFGAKGMDSYAAFPLNDSSDAPIGLLVAMDRRPTADAALAEALLKIFAGRVVAEIERGRANDALAAAALAVSGAHGESVFGELARYLATILHVDLAFIARREPGETPDMRMLAMVCDGKLLRDSRYPLEGSPCAHVLGQRFRAWPSGLRECFPEDRDAQAIGLEGYAGYPLNDRQGRPLGTVGVASRQPLVQLQRIESMLQIFAVRASAELEQLRSHEALSRSEASYRAIFESAEDAIFVHDWDTGAVLDVNPKACETYGYSREELMRVPLGEISSGVPPYTGEQALAQLRQAKLGRCPPIEWQRRNKDGSLHWDELRLKPAQIGGQPHILAFSREITGHKAALAALRSREEQYRAIFDGSADSLVLWNRGLRVVDVNQGFTRLTGYTREEVLSAPHGSPLVDDTPQRLDLIRRALDGQEGQIETRALRKDGSPFDIELRYVPVTFGGEPHALAVGRDITDRLERARDLQRSEARLRATVEAAFDSVIGMDGEGRIVEFNAAAERCFGHRRDDVLGRPLADVILPERYREAHARGLRQFHVTGRGPMIGRLIETTALRADGSEIPVELAMSVAAVPEGSIFIGHMRDIGARRASEQALRDSEAQYRGIFNASADALVLRDADFRIVDVNATYERMSGYSRDEAIGQDRVLANPPAVSGTLRALHRRALAGETVTLETQLVRRDGDRYELELRGVPIRHRGEPHVLYMGRDITKGRRAEQALRDSEEQYRAIFNASADALLLRDAGFGVVEVNPAYLAMSGYSRDEVLGSTRVLTQSDAENALVRQKHAQVLAGELLRIEATETRKDGTSYVAEVRGMPVVYHGQPHVLYVSRDITLRRQAEAQRVELERQLRQAQKMEAIGQLTGGIAHDFNNILTSVTGYLVLAQERAQALDDATLVRQIGSAQLASQRARELIAQMLAFARRQRGERRQLPLGPLVQQSLQLLRSTLPASVALDPPPPAGGDGLQALVDPVQLEQVLFNLCINARDAIQGAGWIRVRLAEAGGGWQCASCRAGIEGGRWVALSVADSGEGIAPEVIERIFEPFFSTKEVGRGSGMGLAMVHGIVHDHGGHIDVQTQGGAGTVFRVMLPAVEGAQDAAPPAAHAARDAAPSRRLAGRVMVVEDEAMVGDFMAELLEGWGLQVVLLRSPLAALAWLEDPGNALDLLITDQTMPQLTGLELAQRAGAARPGLPVLLYTGRAEALEAGELQRHGVQALLRKPVDAQALREHLQRRLAPAPD